MEATIRSELDSVWPVFWSANIEMVTLKRGRERRLRVKSENFLDLGFSKVERKHERFLIRSNG